MMEETGCTIEVGKEIGMIHEQRSAKQFEYDLLQTSYCYEAKILEKGTAPEFTQEEKDE